MVTDETVERVLSVSEVIVIKTCVLWEGSVVDALCVCLEVFKVAYALLMVYAVRLYESGVFEESFLRPVGWHVATTIVYCLAVGYGVVAA